MNRNERKDSMQRKQIAEFQSIYILCGLCEKPLRPCGKKTFDAASAF